MSFWVAEPNEPVVDAELSRRVLWDSKAPGGFSEGFRGTPRLLPRLLTSRHWKDRKGAGRRSGGPFFHCGPAPALPVRPMAYRHSTAVALLTPPTDLFLMLLLALPPLPLAGEGASPLATCGS